MKRVFFKSFDGHKLYANCKVVKGDYHLNDKTGYYEFTEGEGDKEFYKVISSSEHNTYYRLDDDKIVGVEDIED